MDETTRYQVLHRQAIHDAWLPAVEKTFEDAPTAFKKAQELARSKRGMYMIQGVAEDSSGDPVDLALFVKQAIQAQEAYCRERGFPHFAPYTGICHSCNRQIYGPKKHDGTSHVTYCPNCSRSYCD